MRREGRSGSSLMEALLALHVLVLLFLSAITACALAWTYLWAWHVLHEAVMCQAETQIHCEAKGRKRFHDFVTWGQLKTLKIRGWNGQWQGELRWEMNHYQIHLQRRLHAQEIRKVAKRAS